MRVKYEFVWFSLLMLCILMTAMYLFCKLRGEKSKRLEEDTQEEGHRWRETPEEDGGDEIRDTSEEINCTMQLGKFISMHARS